VTDSAFPVELGVDAPLPLFNAFKNATKLGGVVVDDPFDFSMALTRELKSFCN
jgi:hypothetical protein